MKRRLRIGIATSGRFHVLDLARELHGLGHHVRFYSFVPRSRARRFGLADECQSPVTAAVSPILAWDRLAPALARPTREILLENALDRTVAARVEPCDVFIFMSGIFLEAARRARREFGARLWIERGSTHILAQDQILASIPGAARPTPRTIERELEGYAIADRIVVPSGHVERTFAGRPEHAKIFRNPYGVRLEDFPLGPRPPPGRPLRLLFVGAWSMRKGCDLLATAVRAADATLTHVGAIADLPFPTDDPRFVHVDPVDQLRLGGFYAGADAFVHASREEGLSLVLAQALASGLPIVCTDRTGGEDLAHNPALAQRITVTPSGDAGALAAAIRRFAGEAVLAPLEEGDRKALSWRAYAERYEAGLQADLAAAPGGAAARSQT